MNRKTACAKTGQNKNSDPGTERSCFEKSSWTRPSLKWIWRQR